MTVLTRLRKLLGLGGARCLCEVCRYIRLGDMCGTMFGDDAGRREVEGTRQRGHCGKFLSRGPICDVCRLQEPAGGRYMCKVYSNGVADQHIGVAKCQSFKLRGRAG